MSQLSLHPQTGGLKVFQYVKTDPADTTTNYLEVFSLDLILNVDGEESIEKRYGVQNQLFKVIAKPEFKEILLLGNSTFAGNLNMDPGAQLGQWFIYNSNGAQIAGPFAKIKNPATRGKRLGYQRWRDANIIYPPSFNRNLLAVLVKNNQIGEKWGCIDPTGAMVIPAEYGYIEDHGDKYIYAGVGGGTSDALIDRETKEVKCQYNFIDYFIQGLAMVNDGGAFGYIDTTGELRIKPVFQNAEAFIDGKAMVSEKERSYFIDINGKEIEYTGPKCIVQEIMDDKMLVGRYNNTASSMKEQLGEAPIAVFDRKTGKPITDFIIKNSYFLNKAPFYKAGSYYAALRALDNDYRWTLFTGSMKELDKKYDSIKYSNGIIDLVTRQWGEYIKDTAFDSMLPEPLYASLGIFSHEYLNADGVKLNHEDCYCPTVKAAVVEYYDRDSCKKIMKANLVASRTVRVKEEIAARALKAKKRARTKALAQKALEEFQREQAAAEAKEKGYAADDCMTCKGTGYSGGGISVCTSCNGSGGSSCSRCNGGRFIYVRSSDGKTSSQYCTACGGSGKNKCYSCYGTGRISVGGTPCRECNGTGKRK